MRRTQHKGAFLIVEGDTDARFYRQIIDGAACQIVIAHNRHNAVHALAILEKDSFAGVLAIVDADFSVLEGQTPGSPNLLLTDGHDLEAMLIRSPALEKLLGEFGSADKIAAFEKTHTTIREKLLELAKPIGYLRWLSLREGIHLRFEDLQFGKFIAEKTFSIDEKKLLETIKNHSQRHDIDVASLKEQLRSLQKPEHDLWHVCCGHDLICILSIGLRKVIGSHKADDVKPERLEISLRLAFERAFFFKTALYQAICIWEQDNVPLVVVDRS